MTDFIGNLINQVKGTKNVNTSANKPENPEPKEETPEQVTQFIEKLNNLNRSIRTLEERYNNLRRKTQLTDHNILVQHQKLNKELKINDSDLIDIKRDLQKINIKINMLEKEGWIKRKKLEAKFKGK